MSDLSGGHTFVTLDPVLTNPTPGEESEPPSNDLGDYLTVEEAAEVLHVGRSRMQHLIGFWLDGGDKLGVRSYRLSAVLGQPPGSLGGVRERRMIYRADLEAYRRSRGSQAS